MRRSVRNGLAIAGMAGGVWFLGQAVAQADEQANNVGQDSSQSATGGGGGITGNIGVHHVHHLSSKVPCYRLPEVLRDFPELRNIGRITITDSLRCVKLTLWDEERKRLVSFGEARAIA